MILKCNSVIYLLQFYSHHCIAALWFDFVNGFFANKMILWNDQKRAFVFARKLRSTHIGEMHPFSFTPSLTFLSSQSRKLWSQGQAFSIISIEVTSSQYQKLTVTWCIATKNFPKAVSAPQQLICKRDLGRRRRRRRSANDDDGGFTTTVDSQTATQSEKEEPRYTELGFPALPSACHTMAIVPALCLLPHRETASRHFTAHFNATDPIYEGKSAYLWTPPPSFLLSSQMFPKLGSIRQNIRHTTKLSPAWSSWRYHTWDQPLTQYNIYRFSLAAYVESPQIYCSKAIPKNHNFINRFCSKQIQISWGFEFVVKLCIINASQSKMD